MSKATVTPTIQPRDEQKITPIPGDGLSFGIGYIDDGTPYIVISIIRDGVTLAYYGVDIKHATDLLQHINDGLSALITNVIHSQLPTSGVKH